MPSSRLSPIGACILLVGLLFVVGLALALLGGSVLLPQGAVVMVGTLAVLAFLGVQLMVFKLFRLRSRADEPVDRAPDDVDDVDDADDADEVDDDWRAWRG